MEATLKFPGTFYIRNARPIRQDYNESSQILTENEQQKTNLLEKIELDSSSITIGCLDKNIEVSNLLEQEQFLISKRNKILENPFKYFNPLYRLSLKKLDSQLDVLEQQIYSIESEDFLNRMDLEDAISNIDAVIEKYSQS